MSCDRYWRDGIVLVERGLDDPHRAGCADCTRAHAGRDELVETLPRIGDGETGDRAWQAAVWQRIDGDAGDAAWQVSAAPRRAPWRWRWQWQLASGLAVACVLVLWLGVGRDRPDARPRYEVIAKGPDKRSRSAHVDDVLRVMAGPRAEIWLYRSERLVLRCRAREASPDCKPDTGGVTVEHVLSMPVTYHVIIVEAPAAPPPDDLDAAHATIVARDAQSTEYVVPVR